MHGFAWQVIRWVVGIVNVQFFALSPFEYRGRGLEAVVEVIFKRWIVKQWLMIGCFVSTIKAGLLVALSKRS